MIGAEYCQIRLQARSPSRVRFLWARALSGKLHAQRHEVANAGEAVICVLNAQIFFWRRKSPFPTEFPSLGEIPQRALRKFWLLHLPAGGAPSKGMRGSCGAEQGNTAWFCPKFPPNVLPTGIWSSAYRDAPSGCRLFSKRLK